MKYVVIIFALLSLNSCNTLIGIGRDTKHGFMWTKEKIQGTGGGGHEQYTY